VPHSLTRTDALAHQVDAVKAEFRAQSRKVRLGPPRDGTLEGPTATERVRRPRSKRVVAFMGTNDPSRAATQPLPQRAPNPALVHP
jgi:hypothetical protein